MNQTRDQNANQFSQANGSSTHTNSSPIPWAEIFSRHETVLSSHLEMLGEVKGHVSDAEAFRTVSSMVNKTIQAMNQFKVLRKHMYVSRVSLLPPPHLPRAMQSPPLPPIPNALQGPEMIETDLSDLDKTSDNPFKPSATSAKNGAETTTPHSTQSEPTRRKRSRVEQDTTGEDFQTVSGNESIENPRASKRKCDIADPQLDYIQNFYDEQPTAHETEDISEEVQRRLRIREERRRKKESSQVEKRKRDSMLSNESSSPGSTKHRKKRARLADGEDTGSGMGGDRVRKVKKMR